MKRAITFGTVGLVFVWTAAASVAGCGSDAAPISGAADAAPSGTGQNGTSGGTSGGIGDTGSTTDGGGIAAGDASDDGGSPGSGATTPNKIACGAAECTSPGQVCCVRTQLDGGTSSTCQAPGDGCLGRKLGCEEAADCAGGQVCCLDVGIGGGGTACSTTCAGADVQVCKTNPECGDAGPCAEYTCPLGRKVRSCTKPIGCN